MKFIFNQNRDTSNKNVYLNSINDLTKDLIEFGPEYKSLIKPTDIKYPENFKRVDNRLKKFLRELFTTYFETDTQ